MDSALNKPRKWMRRLLRVTRHRATHTHGDKAENERDDVEAYYEHIQMKSIRPELSARHIPSTPPGSSLHRFRSHSWAGEKIVMPVQVYPFMRHPKGNEPIIQVYPVTEEANGRQNPTLGPDGEEMAQGVCLCRPEQPPRGPCKIEELYGSALRTLTPEQFMVIAPETVVICCIQFVLFAIWFIALYMYLSTVQAHEDVPEVLHASQILNTYLVYGTTAKPEPKVLILDNKSKLGTRLKMNFYGPFGKPGKTSMPFIKYQYERLYFLKTGATSDYSDAKYKEVRHTTYLNTTTTTKLGASGQTSLINVTTSVIKNSEPLYHLIKLKNGVPELSRWESSTTPQMTYNYKFPALDKTPGRKYHILPNNTSSDLIVKYALNLSITGDEPNVTVLAFGIKLVAGPDHRYTTTIAYPLPRAGPPESSKWLYILAVVALLYILISLQCDRVTAVIMTAFFAISLLSYKNVRPQADHILRVTNLDYLSTIFFAMLLTAILSDTGFIDATSIYLATSSKKYSDLINTFTAAVSILTLFTDSTIAMVLTTPYVIRAAEEVERDPIPVLILLTTYGNIVSLLSVSSNFYTAALVATWPSVRETAFPWYFDYPVRMFLLMMLSFLVAKFYFAPYFLKVEPNLVTDNEEHERHVEQRLWKRLLVQFPGYGLWRTLRNEMYKHYLNLNKPLYQDAPPEVFRKLRDIDLFEICVSTTVAYIVLNILRISKVLGFEKISPGGVCCMLSIYLIRRSNVTRLNSVLGRINWSTLLMFAGLSVIGSSLHLMHATKLFTSALGSDAVTKTMSAAVLNIYLVSAVGANLISGVAMAQIMPRMCVELSDKLCSELGKTQLIKLLKPFTLASTMGLCVGGTATIFGTPAALATSGAATQQGYHIGAWKYFQMVGSMFIPQSVLAAMFLCSLVGIEDLLQNYVE